MNLNLNLFLSIKNCAVLHSRSCNAKNMALFLGNIAVLCEENNCIYIFLTFKSWISCHIQHMCNITNCMKKSPWWLSHRQEGCHHGDYWRLPTSHMATSYMTAATLMTFSSVIIVIIKFDLRLSIDSVYKTIIIHPFICYVIVCLFRHPFIDDSAWMCLFSHSIYTGLYNFHADISHHYNHKAIEYTSKLFFYTYIVNCHQEFQHPRMTKQSDIKGNAFFMIAQSLFFLPDTCWPV